MQMCIEIEVKSKWAFPVIDFCLDSQTYFADFW